MKKDANHSFLSCIRIGLVAVLAVTVLLPLASVQAQDAVYRAKNEYPVLDEIEADRAAHQADRDSLRQDVEKKFEDAAEARKEAKLKLRVDWSGIQRPGDPEDFDQIWHNPPTPQFYTGSCWAFCSVSYLESEAKRLSGNQVKLAEMWVVYWEYVEKARSFLRSFGHTPVAEGGQDHGTIEVFRQYGVVPKSAYTGVLTDQGRHDHTPLLAELKGYLQWVLDSGSWDEQQNLAAVRGILDKHMGRPPETFSYAGETYDPRTFLQEVLQLDMDDYIAVVSRLDAPFFTRVLLDVPDNWRLKEDYLNLPLEDWYRVIKQAVQDGYTLAIGGDNSEPGMDGMFDTAIIPAWDIPAQFINQASRELRIVNGTTSDDHGVHVVGYTRLGDGDWFLLKDSNRSSRLGQYKGYYFWSGDYIRLKMLSFTIHKDRLAGLLE